MADERETPETQPAEGTPIEDAPGAPEADAAATPAPAPGPGERASLGRFASRFRRERPTPPAGLAGDPIADGADGGAAASSRPLSPVPPLPSSTPTVTLSGSPTPRPVIVDEPPRLSPLVDLSVTSEAEETGPRHRAARISAHIAVTTGVATIVILAFLLIEPSPRWLLLLGAAAVVFSLDGTLRQMWRDPFTLGQETAPFLFVPALYMLAVPVLIEHNVSGELVLPVGLGAGIGFGALAWAEVASVRPMAREYEQARLLVTGNTYLTGFAIFSLSYVFEIGLPAAILATAIAATMLAVEVLREGEIDPMETLGLAAVTGIVVGEMRWLLYYVPLDTYLAGLTLLLAFYLVTGLLHSHVIRALTRTVAVEYSGIAAAGIALVVLARAAGLA